MPRKNKNAQHVAIAVGIVGILFALAFVFSLVSDGIDRRKAREEQRRLQAAQDFERVRPLGLGAAIDGPEQPVEPRLDWAAVSRAFGNPPSATPEEVAEFAPLFESLGRALEREDGEAVERLCDTDRMLDEVVFVSALQGDRQVKADLLADLPGGFGPRLVQNKGLRWKRTDIVHVEWEADRSEAVLYVVHRPAPGDSYKMVWWVVRRPDGWRVFDETDVFLGSRHTRDYLVSPEGMLVEAREPGRHSAAITAINSTTRLMNGHWEPDEADRSLAPARGIPLAAKDAATLAILEGRILARRQALDAALLKFEEAERLVPGMPAPLSYRASTCNNVARYDEALKAIREYRKRVGPDVNNLEAEGYALEGLGSAAEAATAYRRALDDDPDAFAGFLGLCRVIPAAQKNELGVRLARAKDPRKLYNAAVSQAHGENDAAALDALLDGFLKAKPDDSRALGDDIRRKVRQEKFAEAAQILERGLKANKLEDRDSVLSSYLYAMLGAHKPLEAYAAVPAAHADRAFRTLADDLEDELFEDEDEPAKEPERAKQLATLIAAHRKRSPNDPLLWFFEGALLQHAKEYEKAEKAFAAGAAKLPPRKVDPDDPDERDWEAERFRSRRVLCLFKLKKGLGAYRDVGPANDTFRQLANLYDMEKDFDQLEKLIAAHGGTAVPDPERVYWQARVNYRKGEYAAAIPLYRKYLAEVGERE